MKKKNYLKNYLKSIPEWQLDEEYYTIPDSMLLLVFSTTFYQDMVDNDIAERPEAYPHIEKPDTNIDFRRVRNLHVFFNKYAVSLTLDIDDIEQWQPGDIVIFDNDRHIGIISDKRNRQGQPYVIHNGGQPNREENYLSRSKVTGHYRFDASLLDKTKLISMTN